MVEIIALGGLELPHEFQVVLLAPHQDVSKQAPRCGHPTWSLVDIWAVNCACLANLSWDIWMAEPTIAGISRYRG